MRRNMLAWTALLASLLFAAAPASALYLATPLRAHTPDTQVDVGDEVVITIEPNNDSVAAVWRNAHVRAYASYDPNENGDPDAPTSDEAYRRDLIADAIALDDDARGTFRWTIPAELDGKNVGILIESAEGELLATLDLAVGDAPPIMRILAASSGPAEPAPGAAETPEGNEPVTDAGAEDAPQKDVPAPALLATLAAVGALALALRRRSG